jgi:TPR repeat protein
MAKVLSEQYGFQVKLLLDGDATRDNILSAMDQYRRSLHEKDSLLVYYAGHGYADKEEDKAYWLPVDAERNTRSRWIIADELTTRMRSDPARHVLVISDSCYSGGLLRDAGIDVRAADQQTYLSKMIAARSRTLMSSGGNEPVADGGGDGHSVFANTILKALQRTDAKQFTAGDLFHDYVLRQVAGNADQIPKYASIRNSGDDAGDFVFQRGAARRGIERVGPSDSKASPAGGGGAVMDAGVRSAEEPPSAIVQASKRGRYLFDEQEYEEAVELLKTAAEGGDAEAQVYYGRAWENGIGVESTFSQAVKWYRRAAEQGNADGQRLLGHMYEKGWGTRQDDAEAAKWYRKSAEQGNARAQVKLGELYANGSGLAKDVTEAVNWYRKSAEQGNADGQFHLGEMYANGSGVAKDEAEAVKWYRKSAEQGNASGQFHLGEMYAIGSGVAKDEVEAVKWYRKSAEQRNFYGTFDLGDAYEHGKGVGKDLGVAMYWYGHATGEVPNPQAAEQTNQRIERLIAAGVKSKEP